jgi:undecaprenyl-diphosphatase
VELLTAALLGVVQGLTEFLPVSSSAHLILARMFFGWDPERFGLTFDVALHVGTLAAVVAYFRADLLAMLRALPRAATRVPGRDGRRVQLVVFGTLPIVVVGALWTDAIAAATRTPAVAASALLVGAALLLLIERVGSRGGEERLTSVGAVAIGVAQALALVPGVSRAGATIAMGMAFGLRRDVAARFAFLMSVPAILAAAAKEGMAAWSAGWTPGDGPLFAVGTLTAAVVGYVTVKYFIRFLAGHRLDVFAWYRAGLAFSAFGWLAMR